MRFRFPGSGSAPGLNIPAQTLPDAQDASPYSAQLVATGGSGGNVWTVTAGSLPSGLSLSSGGLISGTPDTVETANFTVQVQSGAETATRALSITVNAASTLAISTSSLPDASSGVAYSQQLAVTGETGSTYWLLESDTDPHDDIGLAPAVGILEGTPL